MRSTVLILSALSMGAAFAEPAAAQVLVNGQRVEQREFARELGRYGIPLSAPVPDGAYWYDRISGLWGQQGGPTLGQLMPDLDIGGPLQADASGGATDVYINGRALHPLEVQYLRRLFGVVVPGRFWMNAQGVGGFEGGPAVFNITAAIQAQSRSGSGNWTSRGIFGGMGSDGQCTYFISGNTSATSGCG